MRYGIFEYGSLTLKIVFANFTLLPITFVMRDA